MYLQEAAPISVQVDQKKNFATSSIQDVIEALAQETGLILFYNEEDPFTEWLGNFYPISVAYNGLVFSNSEAAYQAQKFIHDSELMSQFTALTGDQAFRKARELSSHIRPDWWEMRVQVMKEVLAAKIDQNPLIASWLDATGDSFLVEHNAVKGRDAFWSDDFDGMGKNMLGTLWMELRSEIRGEPVKTIDSSHRGWQNYENFLNQLK